ncbi:hypothetical protein AURDEDRAFT_115054 [Auricularia subglabra TFB-10046 SS5]|nr:hypothetical protein AURDEDRAFT_115054 [Auricularia subglabra TFB-10046 SS5]
MPRSHGPRRSSSSFSSTVTLATVFEDECLGPEDVEREDELWFDDGDVVLVAPINVPPEDRPLARSLRAFKVHKKVLIHQSARWKALFGAAATQPREHLEGVDLPVVRFVDGAEDLYHFLQWIYVIGYLGHFSLAFWIDTDASGRAESLLRVANKWDVDALRSDVVDFLEREWPSALEAWDEREEAIREQIAEGLIESGTDGPDAAQTITIASEYNIPSILPSAYYHLNRVFMDRALLAPSAPPSPSKTNSPTADSALFSIQSVVRFDGTLSPAVLRTLLRGRTALSSFIAQQEREGSVCGNGPCCCRAVLNTWWGPFAQQLKVGMRSRDPLAVMHDAAAGLQALYGACGSCQRKARATLLDRRVAIWERLPQFFAGGLKV